MPDKIPTIDFTTIDFPSDKLTIKMVRQGWPDAVDVDRVHEGGRAPNRIFNRHSLDNVLGDGIIDVERLVAERAFKRAMGQNVEVGAFDKDSDLIDSLASEYLRYGLARGEHEVAAMVRRIEAQAESQARQHGGRPR